MNLKLKRVLKGLVSKMSNWIKGVSQKQSVLPKSETIRNSKTGGWFKQAEYKGRVEDSLPDLEDLLSQGYDRATWITNEAADDEECLSLNGEEWSLEDFLSEADYEAPLFSHTHPQCLCKLKVSGKDLKDVYVDWRGFKRGAKPMGWFKKAVNWFKSALPKTKLERGTEYFEAMPYIGEALPIGSKVLVRQLEELGQEGREEVEGELTSEDEEWFEVYIPSRGMKTLFRKPLNYYIKAKPQGWFIKADHREDWKDVYTEADQFKSNTSKSDLIYLVTKYVLSADGDVYTKKEVKDLETKQLYNIWMQNKPKQFGEPPHEIKSSWFKKD